MSKIFFVLFRLKQRMRIYGYVALLLFFFNGCKSDNIDKNTKTELLKDGSINMGDMYWHYSSHEWGDVGKPSESKDFIGSVSDKQFSSGPSSLKISRLQVTEKERSAYWYQNIINPSIPKGSTLVLRAKIRTENIEDGVVAIYILGLFNNDKSENYFLTTEPTQKIKGTSDFKEYELRFDNYLDKYKPTENLQIGLIIGGITKGIVYFDDISLVIE